MRRFHLMIFAAAAFALGACATPSTDTPTGSTPTTSGGIDIEQVRSIATTVCGFVPTVSTVAGIIASFAGAEAIVTTAGAIATQICAAVTPLRSAKRGAARPMLRGVPIHGRFVT